MELLCRYNILLCPKERAEKTHLGYFAAQSFNASSNKVYSRFHSNLLILYETGIKF